jgi:hypothetical protein
MHTYIHMHMHTSDRWWQRAVLAYFVLNIQIGPVLDEDPHHLQMAINSGVQERGPSLLSETDTHSERDATACHHTLPTSYRPLSVYKHTYTHTFIQYAYSKTLAHPYVTAYIHKYIQYGYPHRLRIQRDIALTYRRLLTHVIH